MDTARLKETLTRISPYTGLAFFREEDTPFTAAEKVLTWFDQTKALEGGARIPKIREFFRDYRTKRGNASQRRTPSDTKAV